MRATWSAYALSASAIIYAPKWNLPYLLYRISDNALLQWTAKAMHEHIARYVQLCLVPIPFLVFCFFLGLPRLFRNLRTQAKIKHLGLRTPTGLEPKVLDVVPMSDGKAKVLLRAEGIDIAALVAKKGALESSLNKIVHEIRPSPGSRQIFEIITADKDLPRNIPFGSVESQLTRPYSFLVGEAHAGFVIGDLRELHHMLIAGSTGGGKSVFFKQALIGILKSSRHVHLYLIDLKRGVEMKLFSALPNVYVAKEVIEAVTCLRLLVKEMERRFKILEESNFAEIDPVRDKLDRLVVGIDEASVLFTVEKGGGDSNKKYALEARELCDKLTKLGRAAGIHVILATQKVTKETIDTRVQTNVHAKICFRVNMLSSSMTVLGNKKAYELPPIKGRAIWSFGSDDMEVQVPFLSHEETKEEVELIAAQQEESSEKPFQALMVTQNPAESSKKSRKGSVVEHNQRSE